MGFIARTAAWCRDFCTAPASMMRCRFQAALSNDQLYCYSAVQPMPCSTANHCSAHAALSDKEAVLFLERIAALDRNRAPDAARAAEWEAAFLGLVYTICSTTDSPRVPPAPITWHVILCLLDSSVLHR